MIFQDVLEIKNGRNQKNVEDPEGKYPIYGSGGIIGYANAYICEKDSVIIGRKGSINNPIFVQEPFWNVDTAFGLQTDKRILLPRYLYYFCRKFNFEKLNKAVTIPSLTKADLLKIEINLPTLSMQQQIVDKLLLIEQIMCNQKKELQYLDMLIKARFVEMFGDPVLADKEKKVELSELCEKITDGEHGSVARISKGHPFLNAKHILKNGNIDWDTVTFIGDVDHQKIYKRCNPEKGDILLTTTGTIGNVAIMPECEEISMDRGITLLKINRKKVTSEFVAEMLKQKSIQIQMGANVHASAIGHLFMNKVKKLPAIMPSMERQMKYTRFVKQVDKSKLEVQKALDKTQILFDSLMQQYFG